MPTLNGRYGSRLCENVAPGKPAMKRIFKLDRLRLRGLSDAHDEATSAEQLNDRFWLRTDIQSPEIDFRLYPESRHSRGRH